MLRLKGCPRCKGDIVLDKDHYGWYEHCLQCGYLRDLESKVEAQEQPAQVEKVRELACAS